MSRSRTITWEDPLETFAEAGGMSGLDYLRAIGEGRLPSAPIAQLMGFDGLEAEEGRVVFAALPDEYHLGGFAPYGGSAAYPQVTGVVHGGLALTLLDSAMGCAVHSTLPPGAGYTTLEVKVNFARAITRDTGRIVCEGTVVHPGRTVATAEGRVIAEETGKLLAHGTSTCLISSTL